MGYQNDQFYSPLDTGDTGGRSFTERSAGGRARKNYVYPDADNPRFIYPDRTVRTWRYADVYDRGQRVVGKKHFMEETLLKRGFVRSISRTAGDSTAKCQFQFNPQNLTQGVTMSETMLNFYQQDPAQFAQPLNGNVSMNFTLLFDRSMEINNPIGLRYSPTSGQIAGGASNEGQSVGNGANPRNPWETGSPAAVGVLRDIATLYKVIGQGVNEDDVVGRQAEVKSLLKSEQLADELSQEDYDKAVTNMEESLRINVGNYGMLIPRPVRFMFSSLYMVEGYVTSSVVTFGKFNTSFVPIQAAVELTVNAQHVGFAKKDTFTTYSIAAAEAAEIEFREDEKRLARQSYEAAQAELSTWDLVLEDKLSGLAPSSFTSGLGRPTEMRIRGSRSTDSIEELKKLYNTGGASVKIKFGVDVFLDMFDSSPPLGREGTAPYISYESKEYTYSTVAMLEHLKANNFVGTLRPVPGASRADAVASDFGGNMRYVWHATITLSHNGTVMTGRAGDKGYRVDVSGVGSWGEHIEDTVSLGWSYRGDLAYTPLPSSGATEPSTPSDIGSSTTTTPTRVTPPSGSGRVLE